MGLDGSPLADANGDGRKFHHHFFMPVFHPPFMALNVTYMGLVPMEKSCAIFSSSTACNSENVVYSMCVTESSNQPQSKGDLQNGNSLSD